MMATIAVAFVVAMYTAMVGRGRQPTSNSGQASQWSSTAEAPPWGDAAGDVTIDLGGPTAPWPASHADVAGQHRAGGQHNANGPRDRESPASRRVKNTSHLDDSSQYGGRRPLSGEPGPPLPENGATHMSNHNPRRRATTGDSRYDHEVRVAEEQQATPHRSGRSGELWDILSTVEPSARDYRRDGIASDEPAYRTSMNDVARTGGVDLTRSTNQTRPAPIQLRGVIEPLP